VLGSAPVSPLGDKATATRRPHDAEASRRALLDAARRVFDEVGYDRATTREIGERAGVDPALIARYFDSKEGLFIAAIAAGSAEEEGIEFEPAALLALLLERWEERGHSPISRALASPALTPGAREQISAVVGDRVLVGLVAELRAGGAADPELRAELLVALAVGVAVTRTNGTLETLAAAPREQVLATLAPLLDALAR
jgi:AcrR family transcriptional regulator